MSKYYCAADPDGLIQHQLDSMTLIFQRSSGITHMVADPVPAILQVMRKDAVRPEDIVLRLADQFDLEGEGDSEAIILARLTELCALGLVEQV